MFIIRGMKVIRDTLQAIAQELGLIYLRALNITDLNQLLQSTAITSPLLVLTNVPEGTQPPVTSNFNFAFYRTTILVLDKNATPDPKPEEIDNLLDSLLVQVGYIQDLLDKSNIITPSEVVEFISLNSTDSIELTDEVISGWELVINIPINRSLYYCEQI